jgi:hypothetical protein
MNRDVEQLLRALNRLCHNTSRLTLISDVDDDVLIELQTEKESLCESLDRILLEKYKGNYSYTAQERMLMEECFLLEKALHERMHSLKSDLSRNIGKMKAGHITKQSYGQDIKFNTGEYIDSAR